MKRFYVLFLIGLTLGVLLTLLGGYAVNKTSSNDYCMSCHVHTSADALWQQSDHYQTASGVRTSCVECHLPPKGEGHLPAKVRTGLKDLWSYWTKDTADLDWNHRRRLEVARTIVYEDGCIKCHENLFPLELSQEGEDAHLYYKMKKEEGLEDLHCINCHQNAGHYIEGYTHGSNSTFGQTDSSPKEIFLQAARVDSFATYTETIPNSSVSFKMVAIPGGTFTMGSSQDEPHRRQDEGPQRQVEISPFFMAEIEASWNEYMAFYAQTSVEGRTTDTEGSRLSVVNESDGEKVDAISGATPPYGQPDQGWGMGQRPVISITHHAAETYCKWLSQVTGKTYRLPTEAEWEYAARGGTSTAYPFEGDPAKFEKTGWLSKLSKNDTTRINTYIIYAENSRSMTQLPEAVAPNPFGLKNMLGNVAEFCSDWYAPDAYSTSTENKDPKGPAQGKEHVVRGGAYFDGASGVRSAARSQTRTDAWLRTDPQIPKSIWWYSDCFSVGFRVVCEWDPSFGDNSKN